MKNLINTIQTAQADANPFFAAQGFEKLAVSNPAGDYPHRWWKPVSSDDNDRPDQSR